METINFIEIAAKLNKTDFDLNRVNKIWAIIYESFEFMEDCWDYEEGVEAACITFDNYSNKLTADEIDMIDYAMVEIMCWEKE